MPADSVSEWYGHPKHRVQDCQSGRVLQKLAAFRLMSHELLE